MKNKITSSKRAGYILQDLGVLVLFAVLFAGLLIVINVPAQLKLEFIILLLITFCCMLIAAFRMTIASVVLAGLQITIYTAYKLFFYYKDGVPVITLHYVWILYPLLAVGGVVFFINNNVKLEMENEMLKDQIYRLVLVDPLTGLYNLKGLYVDLQGQIALAERKGLELTLMIITLRYEEELRRVLGKTKLDIIKQRIATSVQDTIRMEDRMYAIDEKGSLAIILSCDTEGAELVKKRIKENFNSPDAMPEIVKNKIVKIDLQFGYLQYDAAIFGKDVIGFKQRVESELQYDV